MSEFRVLHQKGKNIRQAFGVAEQDQGPIVVLWAESGDILRNQIGVRL